VYFRVNRSFATGLFQGFFDPISPIIFIIPQNREWTILRREKPACLNLFGQRIAFQVACDMWNTEKPCFS